ncbi:MAG TPA: hypothetical protein VNA89_12770 [Gemmatimonadaceae bacterium]|nr:hypothetical protein [Gemmatimonadaceae bacterium]
MRCLTFTAVLGSAVSAVARAQDVPARDLLDFPIGALAEAPSFASQTGDGLWNPATIALKPGVRGRGAISALATPADQGVDAQLLTVAVALPGRVTSAVSLVRASVDDILRTDADPQSVGGEVPYATTLVSASVAQRRDRLSAGLALRYRMGTSGDRRGNAAAVDGGVVIRDALPGVHLALSSFLWQPGAKGDEATRYRAAAELLLLSLDSLRTLRAGYEGTYGGPARGHYLWLAGRLRGFHAHLGLERHDEYDRHALGLRMSLGLHYARYVVGVGREENDSGLGGVYQFTLSASLP